MGRDVLAACRDEAALRTTDVVQPALLAVGVAAYRVLEAEGVAFAGAAGHSLGEFSALVAAGVLELAAALDIVVIRGRAMQEAGTQRPGAMTALIGAGAEQAAELCDEARRGRRPARRERELPPAGRDQRQRPRDRARRGRSPRPGGSGRSG